MAFFSTDRQQTGHQSVVYQEVWFPIYCTDANPQYLLFMSGINLQHSCYVEIVLMSIISNMRDTILGSMEVFRLVLDYLELS